MITSELAGFLQEGLSIHIGCRDEALLPAGARASAAIVEPDGRHLVVHVAQTAAARLLPHLHSNGQVAVGFGRPEDERACQVKGVVLSVHPSTAADEAHVTRQWQGLMGQFEKIGIPRAMATGWHFWPTVAIRLKVTAVFEQTPGPHAGTPMG